MAYSICVMREIPNTAVSLREFNGPFRVAETFCALIGMDRPYEYTFRGDVGQVTQDTKDIEMVVMVVVRVH